MSADTRALLENAYASTTRQTYNSHMSHWYRHCEQEGWPGDAPPPDILRVNYTGYLYRAGVGGQSIPGYVSAVMAYFAERGIPLRPVKDTPLLSIALRGCRRMAAPKEQRSPMEPAPIARAIAAVYNYFSGKDRGDWTPGEARARRVMVLALSLSMMCGLREHTVAALRDDDVRVTPGSLVLTLSHEKGAEHRQGFRRKLTVWATSFNAPIFELFRMLVEDRLAGTDVRHGTSHFFAHTGDNKLTPQAIAAYFFMVVKMTWNPGHVSEQHWTHHSMRHFFVSYGTAIGIPTELQNKIAGWCDGSTARTAYYTVVRVEPDSAAWVFLEWLTPKVSTQPMWTAGSIWQSLGLINQKESVVHSSELSFPQPDQGRGKLSFSSSGKAQLAHPVPPYS